MRQTQTKAPRGFTLAQLDEARGRFLARTSAQLRLRRAERMAAIYNAGQSRRRTA